MMLADEIVVRPFRVDVPMELVVALADVAAIDDLSLF